MFLEEGTSGARQRDGAFIAANRHVECEDCHSPHGSGKNKHPVGTNAITLNNPMNGATGVEPTPFSFTPRASTQAPFSRR